MVSYNIVQSVVHLIYCKKISQQVSVEQRASVSNPQLVCPVILMDFGKSPSHNTPVPTSFHLSIDTHNKHMEVTKVCLLYCVGQKASVADLEHLLGSNNKRPHWDGCGWIERKIENEG